MSETQWPEKTETPTHNVKQSTPSALQRIDLREFIFWIYRCSQMLQILQHCIYWNALDVLSAANIQTFMTAIHSISIPRSPSKHVNSNILCLGLMCTTCQNVDRRIKVAESTKWFASHNKNKSTVTKAREGEPKSYLTEYLCSKKTECPPCKYVHPIWWSDD